MQNSNLDYPNMEFPYKYTKNGQKELLEKYTKQNTIETQSKANNNLNNQNTNNSNNASEINNNNQNTNNNQNNDFNIFNLLTNLMNNNKEVETMDSNKNKNFDMSKLLSLFLNKNLKQNDLINMLIPMLSGNNNLPIKDLLNLGKTNTKEQEDLPKKEPIMRYGYKKVE